MPTLRLDDIAASPTPTLTLTPPSRPTELSHAGTPGTLGIAHHAGAAYEPSPQGPLSHLGIEGEQPASKRQKGWESEEKLPTSPWQLAGLDKLLSSANVDGEMDVEPVVDTVVSDSALPSNATDSLKSKLGVDEFDVDGETDVSNLVGGIL